MTSQQLRLTLGDLSELAFKNIGDSRMQCTSWLPQKRAIGDVLHQGMFEEIACVRRYTLPEKQTCNHETIKC